MKRPPQFTIKQLLILTVVLAIPLAAVSLLLQRRNAWIAEIHRRAEQDVVTLKQVVMDVDAVCKKLGRAPKDQEELETLMGKPLPHVHDNGRPTPIHYQCIDESSYLLQYELWATDDWIYNSTRPEEGWVQHWY